MTRMVGLPDAVFARLAELRKKYQDMADRGVANMLGFNVTYGRMVECSIELFDWIQDRLATGQFPDLMSGVYDFKYLTRINKSGRPSNYDNLIKKLGHRMVQRCVYELAGKGIIGPSAEQIVEHARMLNREIPFKEEVREAERERMQNLKDDPEVISLDDATKKIRDEGQTKAT